MMFKSGVASRTIQGTKAYYSPQIFDVIENGLDWNTVDCSKNDVFALGLVFLQVFNKLEQQY